MIKKQTLTKTILIATTHHTPAIELTKQLQNDPKYFWSIHYVGHIFPSETHITNTIIPKLKIPFHNLDSGKLDRRYLPNTIKGIPRTIKAIFDSISLIQQIKPDIVVSFGGYLSVPIIIAAKFFKIPSITHEQTLTASLATRINSYFVNKVALSFNNKKQISKFPFKKISITGNLLRSEIFNLKNINYLQLEDKIKTRPLIYITGGNQGSSIINKTILKIIKNLSSKYTIIHNTGNIDIKDIKKQTKNILNYYPTTYVGLEDIGWVLNKSNLIISRSGANISQEIVALNKKSILIPLPKSQQNEQLLNALWVKKNLPEQTIILNQDDLLELTLKKAIDNLFLVKTKINQNQTQINYNLLKLIHETV